MITAKQKTTNRRALSWLLLLAIMLSLALTGCGGTTDPVSNPTEEETTLPADVAVEQLAFFNPLPIPEAASESGALTLNLSERAREKHALNSDTVGWLQVPNTTLDDVIVWYPGDRNAFYLRRNFDKVPNTGPLQTQYGSYFADYRCAFDGGRQGLARNTVLYGHSMEDDPNGGGFSQLKKYLNEDFAKANPYIYFSTTDEEMAWEVFAVFYATIELPYNRPQMTATEFPQVIGESLKRSVYNYDTDISAEDKILTLSTCCYNFSTSYPNNYRYVIMAKLVKPGEVLAKEAALVKNPSPKEP